MHYLYTYHHNQTLIFDLHPKLYKIQKIQHKKAFKILMSQLSRIVCIHDTRHMYNICMENAKDTITFVSTGGPPLTRFFIKETPCQ